MPMIEFEGPDGDRIEQFHHSPVGEVVVNGVVYKKAPIPSGIMLSTGAQPTTQADEIKSGCYAHECNQKPWTIKYSKNQIRKIWGI